MSGTSAVTAVIYAGTTQSLCELLACATLYQSCHSRSCGGCFPSRSCRLATIAFLCSKFISAVISAKHIYICINIYTYGRIGTDENNMKI